MNTLNTFWLCVDLLTTVLFLKKKHVSLIQTIACFMQQQCGHWRELLDLMLPYEFIGEPLQDTWKTLCGVFLEQIILQRYQI